MRLEDHLKISGSDDLPHISSDIEIIFLMGVGLISDEDPYLFKSDVRQPTTFNAI